MSAEIIKSIMGHFDKGYPAGTNGHDPRSPLAAEQPELGGWGSLDEAFEYLLSEDREVADQIAADFLSEQASDLMDVLEGAGSAEDTKKELASLRLAWSKFRDAEVESLINAGQLDRPAEQRQVPDESDQT